MRTFFLCVVLTSLSSPSFGQDASSDTTAEAATPLTTYLVQIAELRLSTPLDPIPETKQLGQAIEELNKAGKVELNETVLLTAISGHESMAQFGKTLAVTTGVNVTPRGQMPIRQHVQVGTMVRVTVMPKGEQILVKLQYEASRHLGPGTENGPPDTGTVQCQTTLLVDSGEPVLAGGLSSDSTSLVLLSVKKLPAQRVE